MGLDWLSVAMEASGGGIPDLLCSRMFLGYMEIYRRKKYVRGATRAHKGGGRALGGCARPPTSWPPQSFLDIDSKSFGLLSFPK